MGLLMYLSVLVIQALQTSSDFAGSITHLQAAESGSSVGVKHFYELDLPEKTMAILISGE